MKYYPIKNLINEIPIFDEWDFICKTCSYPDGELGNCFSCNIIRYNSPEKKFFDKIISAGKYFQTKKSKSPEKQSEYNLTWLIINYKEDEKFIPCCAELLDNLITDFIKENGIDQEEIIICCIPDHPDERYQKNVKLLQEVGNRTKIEVREILEKIRKTKKQHYLKAKDRFANVRDAYKVKSGRESEIKEKTIFIIDDVISTAASLNECAKELKKEGANKVYGFSLGRNVIIPEEKKEE